MKIKKFNELNELNELNENKKTSLIEPSDQEIKWAENYLEEGIDPSFNKDIGYFYIDVSGKYSVYYTLWRFNPNNKTISNFITNLSTDFKTAVEKAKKASGRIPIFIDRYGTKSGLFKATKAEIITFGKYRGKTLGDIFVEDPKYIIWLYKNYDGKNPERYERIKYYNDLYWETITNKNLEESNSKHQGKIGDKVTLDLKIYKITNKVIGNQYGETDSFHYGTKMIDKDGNKYYTYNLGKNFEPQLNDEIRLQAKIASHKEILGIKFTVLNYCKVLSSLFKDMKNYNL